MMRPLIDGHLDLAWNALSFDRDLTQLLEQVRQHEQGMTDSACRGRATVCFDAMHRGGVAICLGTLLARAMPSTIDSARQVDRDIAAVNEQWTALPPQGPRRIDLDFRNQATAHSIARGQLAWYQLMQRLGHIVIIRNRNELDAHWQRRQSDPVASPLGVVLSMEGADPIVEPGHLDDWHAQGLRVLGLVHYGQNRYAVGTGFDGPLTHDGRTLLAACERLGVMVDVTHLSDTSMAQTLEAFSGPVIASHHNCRALIPGDRQLDDGQIRALIQRDAVIGSALDAWMLCSDWKIGQSERQTVGLDAVADQIDHVCQLAGSCRHAAIGSDLDGGFGTEQSPYDLDSIADLQKLESILCSRGYGLDDLDAIFHGNWLRLLRRCLPTDDGENQ